MQPPEGPPICTALKLPPVLDAAADLLDDLADGDAHRHLDQAAAADLAGQGEDLGALARRGAERGEGLGAVAEDPRHAGERLDVVDEGGLAAEAALGRVRRPQPRHAALAFERRDQRGLLAADERARPFAHLEAQRKSVPRHARRAARALGLLRWPRGCAARPADTRRGCRRSPRRRRPRRRRWPAPRGRGAGSDSSTMRSMNAPGSPSSPLQMTYFAGAGWRRARAHLRPVGKPAPPRPRRPEAGDRGRSTSSGAGPWRQAAFERAVAVAREVLVDARAGRSRRSSRGRCARCLGPR